MDFIKSFELFLLKKNPDVCLTCWGEGKLQAMHRREGKLEVGLPITGLRHEIECPNCKGKGEKLIDTPDFKVLELNV